MTPFDKDMKILSELSFKLYNLTKDPQPGSFMWKHMLVTVMTDMKNMLERISVGENV
jgi:hypothetical protein